MTIKQLDRLLKKSSVCSSQLAEVLGISRSAISKWRARGVVPRGLDSRIEAAIRLHQLREQQQLGRRAPELF